MREKAYAAVHRRNRINCSCEFREKARPTLKIVRDEEAARQIVEIIEREESTGSTASGLDESAIQIDRFAFEENLCDRIEVAKCPALSMRNAPGGEGIEENRASSVCKIHAKLLAEA